MIKLPGLKWISLVLCLLCMAGASFAFVIQKTHASSAAALANPGFEGPYTTATPAAGSQQNISGAIANGWTDDTAWTSDTIVYAQDTTIFHGGQSSQRVDIQSIPAGQAWQFRQTLPLQADQLYTASIWLRGIAGLTVQLRLQLANAPYTSLAEGQVQLSDQWTQVTAVGVVPTTSVLFQIRSVQTGTLWMDDAQLTSTPAPPLTPPTSAIPRSYFGMETKNLPPTTPWPAVNFGTLRLWDSGVPWNALEPARGVYDFTLLNNWVNAAQQHHAEIILTLAVTPQWASSRPNEPSVYGPGGAAPPANMQDWIDFVTKVATTFKGKIHYYEVWNEPDLPIFYTGTIDQLVSLSNTAYTALKGVDPSIKVISPPFSSSTGWLDNFLAKGGGNSSDIIGFHFYATDNPEYMPIQITNVRLVMQRYHLKQPLWDTEAASGTSQTPPIQGAGLVARTYLLNWAAGAQRYVWYAWDNHVDYPGDAPMTQADNTTITREATAYQEVENWLVGSRMLSLTTDTQNTWTIALQQPDGSKAWIVWNPDQAVTLSLPDAWHINWLEDLYGNTLNLQGNRQIQVAGSPVLLTTF